MPNEYFDELDEVFPIVKKKKHAQIQETYEDDEYSSDAESIMSDISETIHVNVKSKKKEKMTPSMTSPQSVNPLIKIVHIAVATVIFFALSFILTLPQAQKLMTFTKSESDGEGKEIVEEPFYKKYSASFISSSIMAAVFISFSIWLNKKID